MFIVNQKPEKIKKVATCKKRVAHYFIGKGLPVFSILEDGTHVFSFTEEFKRVYENTPLLKPFVTIKGE